MNIRLLLKDHIKIHWHAANYTDWTLCRFPTGNIYIKKTKSDQYKSSRYGRFEDLNGKAINGLFARISNIICDNPSKTVHLILNPTTESLIYTSMYDSYPIETVESVEKECVEEWKALEIYCYANRTSTQTY